MLFTRRGVAGGLVFGLPAAGLLPELTAEASQRSSGSSAIDRDVVEAVQDMVRLMRLHGDPPVLPAIRESQRFFLRGNQKFPEYIEIGIAVWEQLYDWHVHNQQPLDIVRLPDGRYSMRALLSLLVLRVDVAPTYVGPGSETP